METSSHRLSRALTAELYEIELSAHPRRQHFSGRLRAQLRAAEQLSELELHARELTLSEVTVDGQPCGYELRPERQTVVFHPSAPVGPGPVALELHFAGRLSERMHGLYLATDGHDAVIASQCEATDARGIFPCLDEPEFKARIKWSLRTPKDMVALANGPLVERVEDEGELLWRFGATPPVSTYLAAVCVGHLEASEAVEVRGGVPVQVWTMPGRRAQAEFAREVTAQLIPMYEDYFGQPYAYGKYDQVAVPGFDAGAMENVGLVLFRQNLLLMEQGAASWEQEKLIAKVVAHELAHMWFGNLVTMRWWDDLWLNEAFAEWFAHKAVHALRPEYSVWSDFLRDKSRAQLDDALPTTHAIWAPVQTPDEALEMFDVITYQKGCAVMRMLERFVGDEAFKAGIRSYMAEFREDNAEGADLWRHLSAASGQLVGPLMKSWVEQAGFPVVRLGVERAAGALKLSLSQRRSYSDPKLAEQDNGQLWSIPLILSYADEAGRHEQRVLLQESHATVELHVQGDLQWLYGNAEELGFYRVRPEGEAARLLQAALPSLSADERVGCLEDHWALLKARALPLPDFWGLAERLADGAPEHNLLSALCSRYAALDRMLSQAAEAGLRDKLRAYLYRFLPQLEALGYSPEPGESRDAEQRRAALIHLLGAVARHPQVIAEATALWAAEREDPRAVHPSLAGECVHIAALTGDADRYLSWMDTYRARKAGGASPQESLRYLYTLSDFRPAPLTKKTLSALSAGEIPQESVGRLLGRLLSGRHSQALAWDYLQRRWRWLQETVGDMGISHVVEAVGALPMRERDQIERFFAENPPAGAERALSRALRQQQQRAELQAWLLPALSELL